MFDTQIPEWGLIFATSVQCSWFVKTQDMPKNGRPTAYLDAADGALHEYTDASAADPVLSRLIKTYNGYKIRRNVSPYFGVEANLTF